MLADTNATYTPGLSERRGSTSKFYHTDALGSTRGITNTRQTATDSQLFDAWGMVVSRTGSTPTPFGFAGTSQYQTDPDSGLQLLGHRYYDPSTGRFITQDPARDGENWYAYCGNGPLGGVDPLGLWESGSYLGDAWRFAKGELGALNPKNWYDGVVSAGGEIIDKGWDGVISVGGKFLNGLNPLNKPDLEGAGSAFMGDLIIAVPIIKRIPNPTPISLEGPWIGKNGSITVVKISLDGKQVGRVDIGELPPGADIPPWLKGIPIPHYHRRGPGGIGRHRPWQHPAPNQNFRSRF